MQLVLLWGDRAKGREQPIFVLSRDERMTLSLWLEGKGRGMQWVTSPAGLGYVCYPLSTHIFGTAASPLTDSSMERWGCQR